MRRTQALRKAPLEAGQLQLLWTSEEIPQETQIRDRALQAGQTMRLATRASEVSALTTHPVRSRRTTAAQARARSGGAPGVIVRLGLRRFPTWRSQSASPVECLQTRQLPRFCGSALWSASCGQTASREQVKQTVVREPTSPPARAISKTPQSPPHPAGSGDRAASGDARASRYRRSRSSRILSPRLHPS